MKFIMVLLMLVSLSAFAQSTSTTSSNATTAANNAGNQQSIVFQSAPTTGIEYGGTYTIRNVPSVNGSQLVTGNDTCMGSTSGSLNIAGLGLGGGTTYTDLNCKRLKNAKTLWDMGMHAASLALLCKDDENREALEETGYTCPTKK
jgi:hypothetical protein